MTIIGIDEAGRGPLAGPVAVGLIAIKEGFDILQAFPGLADSKKLSEKKRESLYALLSEQAAKGDVRVKVCFASETYIDRNGIAVAVRHALWRGVRALSLNSSDVKVYLDGALCAPPEYKQETVIGGDGTVPAIMLASVAAKVSRDRLMRRLSETYPEYGFEKHKGYGTKAHYEALALYGPCAIHRRSFLKLK